jgi:phosphatidylinositol dimannoside acyltransferase
VRQNTPVGVVKNTVVHVKIAQLNFYNLMPIEARSIINSPLGLNIASLIGRYTPYTVGHRIARAAADFLSARKGWKLVRAVRSNQWIVNGEQLNKPALDKAVIDNFRCTATSIFDLYYYLNKSTEALNNIDPHPTALQLVQRPEYADRGLILAGIHMGNFDMIFLASGMVGVKGLTITLPELNPAYQKQWDMRLKTGIRFVPASIGGLKHAIEYLKAGGLVITALDRPDPSYIYRPSFFGHPSALPIHHVFMALKAHVPVLVASTFMDVDGKFHFMFSDPIEMQPHPDKHTEIISNAESILRVAEDFIRRDPAQWAMTFPVWPDLVDQVPK